MKESKRYFITITAGISLVILAVLSIFKGMDVVATTSIAGILTILSTYIWAETKRPSRATIENIRIQARRQVLREAPIRRRKVRTSNVNSHE